MSEVSGKAIDWKVLKRILGYTRRYRGLFALAISLTITLSFLSVARPMVIRYVVNEFVHPSSEGIKPQKHLDYKDSVITRQKFDSLVKLGNHFAVNENFDGAVAAYHDAYRVKRDS